ncbi:hypothetical protein AAKU52_002543 [Pedobacter sp. CG_S7]|uniref:hypothetical protein n=1 Tax=Pedobacter sp. CG_S7 TaxID=3143930 RepID=UPI00339B5515
MTRFKNTIYVALFFAISMSIFNAVYFDIKYALLSFPISLLVFGFPIYYFTKSTVFTRHAEIDTAGKAILYAGPANHFLNGLSIGGKLYLLDDKIQFQSHQFNIQNDSHVLKLDQIGSVKSYKSLGIIPNGLSITTINGETQQYVVNNIRYWKNEIERLSQQKKNENNL